MSGIFDAIGNGNIEELKRIVTDNPNCVHVEDHDGWTPLDDAIAWGKLEMVQYLWKKGGRPNLDIYLDGVWITPVHVAARDGYTATLEWIITKKVLPLRVLNVKNCNGWTPFDEATIYGQLKMMKFLFEKGGRPNLDIYVHETARNGYTNILTRTFKEKEVLPLHVFQIKAHDGCTPLDDAIDEKEWETVALLRRLMYNLDSAFLAMQRAKRDFHQTCVLRRLPDELLDMVVDEVATRFNLVVLWSSL